MKDSTAKLVGSEVKDNYTIKVLQMNMMKMTMQFI